MDWLKFLMTFNNMKLLMVSTDRKIFEKNSPVAMRMTKYAENYGELHIIVFNNFSVVKQNTVSVLNSKDKYRLEPASNCFIYPTQSKCRILYPCDAIRIGREIVEREGITNITCQDPSLTAMAGVSLMKRCHLPLEIQIHSDISSPYYTHNLLNKIWKMMAKRYLPQADKIRVVSERVKSYLIDDLKIAESKISVRPITVDTEKIRGAPIVEGADLHKKYSQFDKIVLMASRLESEKNVDLAIKAWPEVIKIFPKAGLVIVGEGSEISNLKSEISKLHLSSCVVIESWANQATLISYYKSTDVFLNTSLFEGYGMTLVEANTAGCKIVSTDVGIARAVGAKIVEHTQESVARGIIEVLR